MDQSPAGLVSCGLFVFFSDSGKYLDAAFDVNMGHMAEKDAFIALIHVVLVHKPAAAKVLNYLFCAWEFIKIAKYIVVAW